MTFGRAEDLLIQLQINDEPIKTIKAGLNYQRWFVDIRGCITFGLVSDEELVTGARLLRQRARPQETAQGLERFQAPRHRAGAPRDQTLLRAGGRGSDATSVDQRTASSYLGFGYGVRGVNPRTLANASLRRGSDAGQALSRRAPPGDIRSATAPAITAGCRIATPSARISR